jgi:hypothetical protein
VIGDLLNAGYGSPAAPDTAEELEKETHSLEPEFNRRAVGVAETAISAIGMHPVPEG